MTAPLEVPPMLLKKIPKTPTSRTVLTYIDTGWMSEKKLKWIGWDVDGWITWIDPNGMMYRVRDLKRNGDGIEFEKNYEELKTQVNPEKPVYTSVLAYYTHEMNVQKTCGYCPDRSSVPSDDDDTDSSESTGGVTQQNVTAPPWQTFAGGGAPDYGGINTGNNPNVPSANYGGYGDIYTEYTPPTANPGETIKTDVVTDTTKTAGGGAIKGGSFGTSGNINGYNVQQGKPTKAQEEAAQIYIERGKERANRGGGKDQNVIIRVVFEGPKDKDGNREDVIIEEKIRDGNPTKPTDIYEIWVKGLNNNGGFVSGGSATESWITEPPKGIPKIPVNPVKELPTNLNPWSPPTVEVTIPVFVPPVEPPPVVTPPPVLLPPPGIQIGGAINVTFPGAGASTMSPRMTKDLQDFIDDLIRARRNNRRNNTINRIQIVVSIGTGIMNDANKIIRGGFINVDSVTSRPSTLGRGNRILVPNNNNQTVITNIRTAINDAANYIRTIVGAGVIITTNTNLNTNNTGVIYTFTIN